MISWNSYATTLQRKRLSKYNTLGSAALPGLMLDLGLLKIILGVFFSLVLSLWVGLILRGPILFPFLTLRGKAILYLT